MRNALSTIWVTFQKEGIHNYPAAGQNPNLADVSFLANPHRHIFHFKVTIEVFHDDRDIEFIQFKRWCESLYADHGVLEMDFMSCEMLADALLECIKNKHPHRYVVVSVSEDNENGAEITYYGNQP